MIIIFKWFINSNTTTNYRKNKVADATLFSAGSNFVSHAKGSKSKIISYQNKIKLFCFSVLLRPTIIFNVFTNLHIRKPVIISTRFQKKFWISYTLKKECHINSCKLSATLLFVKISKYLLVNLWFTKFLIIFRNHKVSTFLNSSYFKYL